MLDNLLQLDREAFLAINNGLANGFFDVLMLILRHKFTWIPLYTAVAVWFIHKHKWQGVWFIAFALITFALCDQLSASFIKPLIERLRPCREPLLEGQVRLLVNCGSGFSFPSTHATNHFGFAVIVGASIYKHYKWPLYTLLATAVLVCFSQIYVGVHYPLDVLGGAVLGSLIAGVVWGVGIKCKQKVRHCEE